MGLFQSKPCQGVVGRGTDEKEDICGQPRKVNTGLPSSLPTVFIFVYDGNFSKSYLFPFHLDHIEV